MIESQWTRQELPHEKIEVIYEMGEENSIVRIDGESLAKTLLNLGYSKRKLVPIVIHADATPYKLASFRQLRGNIQFHEGSLVNAVRLAYACINKEIGYSVDIDIPDEYKGMFDELTVDDVLYTFFVGNHDRRLHYIKNAKAGSLSTSMDPEQQRARAYNFMWKSLIGNVHGYTSRAFAHEYEHRRHILQNVILSGPVCLATGILLNRIGDAISLTPEASNVLALIGSVIIGSNIILARMEYQADKAGTEHMRNLMNSISINRQLLEQRVFDNKKDK